MVDLPFCKFTKKKIRPCRRQLFVFLKLEKTFELKNQMRQNNNLLTKNNNIKIQPSYFRFQVFTTC